MSPRDHFGVEARRDDELRPGIQRPIDGCRVKDRARADEHVWPRGADGADRLSRRVSPEGDLRDRQAAGSQSAGQAGRVGGGVDRHHRHDAQLRKSGRELFAVHHCTARTRSRNAVVTRPSAMAAR